MPPKKTSPSPTPAADRLSPPSRRPVPYVSETDFVDLLYHPHTVTALVVLPSALIGLWCWHAAPANDVVANVKLGLAAAAWAFVVFGATHLPDGLMIRPHPVVWRSVLSVAVIYLVALIFLLFQDLATVRLLVGYYDASLRDKQPERSYAEDCRLSTPEEPYKFWATIADVFLVAHALGYWAKTLVIRDWRIVTAVSIGFEVLEVSLQHVLPNFRECWWDHVIVDVLICNAGGTLLGLWTLRLLRAKRYHWVRLRDIPTLSGKASRVLGQLGPRSFDQYRWEVFRSPKRLAQVLFLLGVMFVQEVNCFLLKSILNQAPHHHLVILRLAFWCLLALPALRDFYDFITDSSCRRLGTAAWVGAATLLAESVFIAKLALEGRYFRVPTPSYIALPWLAALACFVLWTVLYFGPLARLQRRHVAVRWPLHGLFYAGFASLLAMCAMGNADLQWGRAAFEDFAALHDLW